MGDILTSADYPDVRYLIGADTSSLPDAVLESVAFLDFIEAVVKGLLDDEWTSCPDFTTFKAAAGNNWLYLRVGTMALLAMRAVGYLRRQEASGVRIGSYSETGLKTAEKEDVAKNMVKVAADAFSRISCRSFSRATVFLASGPTSSGANVPESWEEWFERLYPRYLDWLEEGGHEDDDWRSESGYDPS